MAEYETKLIVKLLAEVVARSKSVKEAYNAITCAAKDDDMELPSYEEKIREIEEARRL